MPTYEYRCPDGHTFEEFQKITADPVAECPVCGAPSVRLISGGAGLHFKGKGFYITDYGKDGKGPRKAPESDAAGKKPESDSSKKTAKPDAGSGSSSSSSPKTSSE